MQRLNTILLFLYGACVAGDARYDETVSAQYIWTNQVLDSKPEQIESWSCGLACNTVKNVHNARVTQYGKLQTMGMVAQYGDGECIVAFRGSKNFLNELLDADFVWTKPYDSCPYCKVHKGFYDSWLSLRGQTFSDLTALGCDQKPIRFTGHSLGAAMAALASFDLAKNYTLKHVYTYGQPRVGNGDWVDAFGKRLANVPYFRVTNYMDAVPHLPPKGFCPTDPPNKTDQPFHTSTGYNHPGPEVFYNATKMGSYSVCVSGEDASCSDQYTLARCLLHDAHNCDHCSYLGLNPCDQNNPKPHCIEPKADADELRTHPGGQDVIV